MDRSNIQILGYNAIRCIVAFFCDFPRTVL